MGARQSGDALLRFADLAKDPPLLLTQHPAASRAQVVRWLDTRVDYLKP